MGLFWDLLQQRQIDEHGDRSASLEARVTQLSADLRRTQQLLFEVIQRLETHLGTDLNQDGRVG